MIKFKQLTIAEAETQFPGCITQDVVELNAMNAEEPNYFRFVARGSHLFSCTYEVGYFEWSIWHKGEWWDLDEVDPDLYDRLLEDDIEFTS